MTIDCDLFDKWCIVRIETNTFGIKLLFLLQHLRHCNIWRRSIQMIASSEEQHSPLGLLSYLVRSCSNWKILLLDHRISIQTLLPSVHPSNLQYKIMIRWKKNELQTSLFFDRHCIGVKLSYLSNNLYRLYYYWSFCW